MPPFVRNTRHDVAKFENIRLKYDLFLLYTLHAVIDVIMEHFLWYWMLDVFFYYHINRAIKFYKGMNEPLIIINDFEQYNILLQAIAVKCRPMKISVWGRYIIRVETGREVGIQTGWDRERKDII